MTVFEYIKSLETVDEMKMFLYMNQNKTKLGLKKLQEWLNSEVEVHDK